MKYLIITLALLLGSEALLQAQVGINNPTPDASAALDIQSTSQGVLVPRMTAAQRGMIASPATGLLVFQTDAPVGFYYYNGTAWTSVGGSGGGDNLGNHTATQDLNMGGNNITQANDITATGTATLGGNAYPTSTGTNGQVLTTNGAGTLGWSSSSSSKMVLYATQTTAQTIAAGSSASNGSGSLTFNNVILAPPAAIGTYAHTTGVPSSFVQINGAGGGITANNSAFTCNQTGYYLINVTVQSTQTSNNFSAVAPIIVVATSTATKTLIFGTHISSGDAFNSWHRGRGLVSQVVKLEVGDIVSIHVQNSSTANNAPINTERNTTALSIFKIE